MRRSAPITTRGKMAPRESDYELQGFIIAWGIDSFSRYPVSPWMPTIWGVNEHSDPVNFEEPQHEVVKNPGRVRAQRNSQARFC